jgi:hypothetical protein
MTAVSDIVADVIGSSAGTTSAPIWLNEPRRRAAIARREAILEAVWVSSVLDVTPWRAKAMSFACIRARLSAAGLDLHHNTIRALLRSGVRDRTIETRFSLSWKSSDWRAEQEAVEMWRLTKHGEDLRDTSRRNLSTLGTVE